MKFLGIIPARFASTRFPGKPLVEIAGVSMIKRVYDQVDGILDYTVVATDDQRIFDHVVAFGGNVVMTSQDHKSGTDRCWEAYNTIGKEFDVVVNIQGDEPFIQVEQIELLKSCFDNSEQETELATLVKPFDRGCDFELIFNPNTPKVILNKNSEAIYFSRSVIPYQRGFDWKVWSENHTYYKHVGLYAYSSKVLGEITNLAQSSLEIAESLEQLRWIENGYKIKVAITYCETIGIDTPEDLAKAELLLVENRE
ncbi:MAG: 3-deoxy-manno-octulosonate cytidylyltransferase [Bacteroidales bacterium]